MMSQGLNPLVFTVFVCTSIVSTCWDLSLFLFIKWDSSEPDSIDFLAKAQASIKFHILYPILRPKVLGVPQKCSVPSKGSWRIMVCA